MINTSYLIDLNTPHRSVEGQYAVLSLYNTLYCLEEQICCLDYINQYAVLVEGLIRHIQQVDTAYQVVYQNRALKIDGYAVLIEVNTAYRDTVYVDRRIRRIRNYTYAFSCEVHALIRRIFFVGYGIPSPPLPLPSLPLLLPSTAHRTDIPEAKISPWKRACFTTPTWRFKVGESLTTAAAREKRYFRSMASSYERETQHDMMEWQRQEASDMVIIAYGHSHALAVRDPAHRNGMEDTDSSC
ncbi:hypothetical protein Tco_0098446 [Tanacetum coccineum]